MQARNHALTMFFFVFFGNKIIPQPTGSEVRSCPACQDPGPHPSFEAQNWFCVYLVPLFRVGTEGRFFRCRRCRTEFRAAAPTHPEPEPAWTWICPRCQNVNPNSTEECLRCRQRVD